MEPLTTQTFSGDETQARAGSVTALPGAEPGTDAVGVDELDGRSQRHREAQRRHQRTEPAAGARADAREGRWPAPSHHVSCSPKFRPVQLT